MCKRIPKSVKIVAPIAFIVGGIFGVLYCKCKKSGSKLAKDFKEEVKDFADSAKSTAKNTVKKAKRATKKTVKKAGNQVKKKVEK